MHTLFSGQSVDVTLNDTAEDGAVRLVGGASPLEGRVEVFLLGQWYSACDYNWDLADATVVCHQLGFMRAVEAPRYAAFGAGSGPSWHVNLECAGTERNLTECRTPSNYYYNFGSGCSRTQNAGVVCSSEPNNTPLHFSHLKNCKHEQQGWLCI